MIPVAIIGAGMAGLACAARLRQAGLAPMLFDKGRGIGGRVATRRIEGLQFDHGAQFVTAQGAGFSAVLSDLVAQGAAAEWNDGRGRSPFVGTPGMSSLARALGAGLDIRQGAMVARLTRRAEGWALRLAEGEYIAARVIVTVPAPQVAGLLGQDDPLVGSLTGVRMEPCLTLMVAIRAPAPFASRKAPDDALSWIAQDSSKPGRPAGEAVAWVAQANAAFSIRHLEMDTGEITALMLPMLLDRLGVPLDHVAHASAHRWRHARVAVPLGQPFLRSTDASLYLGGDWCLGARVEAAWASGTAIADDLLADRP